jgi:tetratricopeptide (TPR) repeat protein
MAGPDGDDASLLRAAQRYRRAGLLSEAIGAYQKLLARHPDSPNSWYNLARLQRQAREHEAALTSYQRALEAGLSAPEEAHLNRGVIFSDDLQRYAEAEHELDAALKLNPAYVPALMNLANLHEDLGRRAESRQTYARILALEPDNLEALARLAQTLPPQDIDTTLIERLHTRMTDPRAASAARASVAFALGRALDARGAYAEAFAVYSEANRLSRAAAGSAFVPYDRAAEARFIDRIIAAFPGPAPGALHSPATPAPLFICGMFRSGSTLLEQLLAQHPAVRAAGELDWVPQMARESLAPYPEGAAAAPPDRFEALAGPYLRHLASTFPGAVYVTDKRPDNVLYLGLIKRLLPAAKILYTTRQPLDNCLSVFFLNLDPSMRYAFDLLDTGHYYLQQQRMMRHWSALYGEDILEVNYDALVREPRAAVERVLGALGLPWNEGCLHPERGTGPVKTASVWQVREPLYQHASGRSAHYREPLAPLQALLGSASR